jgi:hypothetical protein
MQNYEQRLGIDMVSDTHTKFEQYSVKTGMISEQNYTESITTEWELAMVGRGGNKATK